MRFLDRLRGGHGGRKQDRLERPSGIRRFFGRRQKHEHEEPNAVINRRMRRRFGIPTQRRGVKASLIWCERHGGLCAAYPRAVRRAMGIGRPKPLLRTRSTV